MQSKSISDYFFFGTGFRFLKDAEANHPVHGYGWISTNMDWFIKNLEVLSLTVTQRTTAVNELNKLSAKLKKTAPDCKLGAEDAKNLERIMMDIEKTLAAELQGKLAFIVTDKRIDVNKLLFSMKSLFPAGVFDCLPDIARSDLIESGRCIAFELPTAAAFHLLRGTESVLGTFYGSLVKRGRVSMWGPMIAHLRKLRKPPDETLLNNLDNIRVSFRNPTQHPDKIYDIDEVQDLFALCCDVMCRMVRATKKTS